jgi:hypothetical protein
MAKGHWLVFPPTTTVKVPAPKLVAIGSSRGKVKMMTTARVQFTDNSWSEPVNTRVIQRKRKWVIIFSNLDKNIKTIEFTWLKAANTPVTKQITVDITVTREVAVDIVYPPASTDAFEIAQDMFAAWGTVSEVTADLTDDLTFLSDEHSVVRDGATWIITYGALEAEGGDEGTLTVTAKSGSSTDKKDRKLKIRLIQNVGVALDEP